MFENFIFFLLVLLATYFANKKNFLPNFTGDTHQKFFKEKKIPLIGGTFVLICLFRVFINDNLFIHLVFLCIFFIGFLSDTKLLSSPKLRLFLQLIFVLFFVLYFKIEVTQNYEDDPWHVVLFDKDGEHVETFGYDDETSILQLLKDIEGGIHG